MPIFVLLIGFALAFYIFYKTKYIRSKFPVEKKWLSAKSNIALGLFVFFFGVNYFFNIAETISNYLIAGLFIIYGGIFSWIGYKKYKHYLPFAIEEAEMVNAQNET
ncbi:MULTISPECIES: YtpI family protein [Bacillaceae]|uniref:YtpI family protein n=1 Tax=Bacillaceae TaxID=186817 RepID=UPI002FFD64A4